MLRHFSNHEKFQARRYFPVRRQSLRNNHASRWLPVDVQIAKRDDLAGDRDSGLVLNEAIAKLRDESFGIFEN